MVVGNFLFHGNGQFHLHGDGQFHLHGDAYPLYFISAPVNIQFKHSYNT